ncbi:MAG: hypothetical protein O6947_01490 [Acidobacteria bacterium]|nr:hypothetical protein [Acidobacteriota bacterium]
MKIGYDPEVGHGIPLPDLRVFPGKKFGYPIDSEENFRDRDKNKELEHPYLTNPSRGSSYREINESNPSKAAQAPGEFQILEQGHLSKSSHPEENGTPDKKRLISAEGTPNRPSPGGVKGDAPEQVTLFPEPMGESSAKKVWVCHLLSHLFQCAIGQPGVCMEKEENLPSGLARSPVHL